MRKLRTEKKVEKKLYCVHVTLYVMAENTSEACVAATRAPFDIFECTARRADQVGAEWADSIPYNTDDERTCAQILAVPQAIESPAPLLALDKRPRTSLSAVLAMAAPVSSG